MRYQWPATVLAELSEKSSLVVVGRHALHRPFPQRLGSVAHTMLRSSVCPVMVVPVASPNATWVS